MSGLKRPTRKASARVIYVDGKLFGNPGNWEWVEDRDYIRACMHCRVVYPFTYVRQFCPRHGPTHLVGYERLSLEPQSDTLA